MALTLNSKRAAAPSVTTRSMLAAPKDERVKMETDRKLLAAAADTSLPADTDDSEYAADSEQLTDDFNVGGYPEILENMKVLSIHMPALDGAAIGAKAESLTAGGAKFGTIVKGKTFHQVFLIPNANTKVKKDKDGKVQSLPEHFNTERNALAYLIAPYIRIAKSEVGGIPDEENFLSLLAFFAYVFDMTRTDDEVLQEWVRPLTDTNMFVNSGWYKIYTALYPAYKQAKAETKAGQPVKLTLAKKWADRPTVNKAGQVVKHA
jgi:hypothetical protein